MRTIKDHARNAKCLMEYIPVNVSGVVFSFAEWMHLACETMNQQERQNHPITKAYIEALASIYEKPCFDIVETDQILTELDSLIESKEVEGL